MNTLILCGDSLTILKSLRDRGIQSCITSPPYWRLRDYGHEDQLGSESSPEEYVDKLVTIISEVKRVLKKDGTLWLNLGDTYVKSQMVGIPWRVAFALQKDGWLLRQDIIWHKPNPMPDGAKNRCTRSHEYLFLFSKSPKYYFDYVSIEEETQRKPGKPRRFGATNQTGTFRKDVGREFVDNGKRRKRSVWTVPVKPYKGAHFATFPDTLVEPAIIAGSPRGAVVLDPFAGVGTTGVVAKRNGRGFIGIDILQDNCKVARDRISQENPLLDFSEK